MSFIRLNRGVSSALLHDVLRTVQKTNIRHRHAISATPARLLNSTSCICRSNVVLSTGLVPFRRFSISPIAQDAAKAAPAKLVWVDAPAETVPSPAPTPTPSVEEIPANLNDLGELSFSALGLGGPTPIGLLQSGLEYIHVTTGLPWWGTIAVGTLIIRTLMTPAIVMAHKNATPITNALPGLYKIYDDIAEAKKKKDKIAVSRHERNRIMFLREAGYQPLKNGLMPILTLQALVTYMVSMQYMIDAPVKALENGGLLWFSDLAAHDPYYVLPAVSCATFWLMARLQSDGYVTTSDYRSKEMYFQQVAPILAFPLVIYLPAGLNLIWASFNLIALTQGLILRIPAIRRLLKIPQLKWHGPPAVKVPLETPATAKSITGKK